jgi:hypothetical protein
MEDDSWARAPASETGLLLLAETKRRIYRGRWRALHAADWSSAFGGDEEAHLPRAVACSSRGDSGLLLSAEEAHLPRAVACSSCGGSPSPHTEADARRV